LAKSAKESGVNTYVLISSANAKANSWLPYVALGFEKCVIVRPGVIVGSREKPRAVEQPLHYVANFMGAIAGPLKNVWAQDASAIAKAAIRAATEEGVWEGRKTVEGKNGGKVWFMGQGEIVELGSN
jgi:nucleoside-diphosphate-sugar epimerase